jgi:hypothetical protein
MKKKTNKDNKEVTLKNYIIYSVIVLVTIILLLYLRSWYHEYKQQQLKVPVIRGYLNEINYQELNSYVKENPNLLVYACAPSRSDCRNLEYNLRKEVKKYNLKEKLVYLNILENNLSDMNRAYGSSSIVINDIPFIAMFDNGKIVNIEKSNSSKDRMDADDIIYFLEKNEIIVED